MRKAIIVFLRKNNTVLLLHSYVDQDRVSIFWQGVSGFIESGEDATTAALREIQEELSVSPDPTTLIWKHQFEANDIAFDVFTLDRWHGIPEPYEDGIEDLRWFSIDTLPFSEMRPTDKDWLPGVLGER